MSFHASCKRSNSCHRCKTCSCSSDDTCIHANYAVCNETNTRRIFKTIMLFNAQCTLCKLSNSCCLSCNLSHAPCNYGNSCHLRKECIVPLKKYILSIQILHHASDVAFAVQGNLAQRNRSQSHRFFAQLCRPFQTEG